jgi:hypothetical protein
MLEAAIFLVIVLIIALVAVAVWREFSKLSGKRPQR